jgi:predicted AAA+ superfamily ATPase
MINTEDLKGTIVSGENFILNQIGKIIPRDIVFPPEDIKKAGILYGIRRSGKSYILFDIFKKSKGDALYVDFEDERLEGFKAEDFERLKEAFFELKPHLINKRHTLFLFDEIQNIGGWEKFLRRMVEREGINVFATGSSSKMMPREIHTSLRGRSWGIEISPFSFREFVKAKNIDTNDLDFIYGSKKALVKNCFHEYLKFGAFPEIAFLKSEYEKRKVIKEYLEAMFFKDLVERFSIKNIQLLDVLRDKLFSSFSLKHSLTSFCKQYKDKFPFSKDSAFIYFRYFLESMLIFEVKKFSESSYQRLRNPAKIYLIDVGLAKKVTSQDTGRVLENIVFLELRKDATEVFYFEDIGECDFVVKNQDGLSCYQVVWEMDDKTKSREVNGLLEASKHLKLKTGTILTYDQEGQEKINGFTIVIKPVWKWLLQRTKGAF